MSGAAFGLVASIVAFALLFDWNWLKEPIERRVTESSGRRLEIVGDLAGGWALRPRVRMGGVRFANPGWARDPELLTADSVQFRIDLPALISGRVQLDEVVLERPVIALERAADGRRTWLFDVEQQDESAALHVDSLRIHEGRLRFRDAVGNSDLEVRFSDETSADGSHDLRFSASGTLRGQLLEASGSSAPLLRLRDESLPVPFALKGTIARTAVSLEGAVSGLENFSRADLRYDVRGPSLKRLGPLFGVALPETAPYRVSGRLIHSGKRWETTDLKGRSGGSDIAGRVLVLQGSPRPRLEARLESRLLDMKDLGPLIGIPQGPARAASRKDGRVLPDIPFDVSRVRTLDADVILSAREVRDLARLPLDNFHAAFRLADGNITVDPLRFGFAGGAIASRVEMDGRIPIRTRVSGKVQGVRMARIFPEKAETGEAAGSLSGTFDVHGRGNSVAAMLGSADGGAALLMTGGKVTSLWPALADLDGWRILVNYLGGTRPETVRCTVAELDLKGGVASPRAMLIDTDTTVITVTGAVNLADETIRARIVQAPKNPSLLSLRTPINVEGSLRSPQVSLEKGGLIARGAGALALGLINALASVFASIEPGPGKDTGCGALVQDVRERLRAQAAGQKVPG